MIDKARSSFNFAASVTKTVRSKKNYYTKPEKIYLEISDIFQSGLETDC